MVGDPLIRLDECPDPATAEKLLLRWRSAFSTARDFESYQNRLGLSPDLFQKLLCESADHLSGRIGKTPAWLEHLRQAFCSAPSRMPRAGAVEFADGRGLNAVVWPLISRFRAELREKIAALPSEGAPREILDPDRVSHVVVRNVAAYLHSILNRALTLELHAARLRGSLFGRTPAARFDSFVQAIEDPAVAGRILMAYPVLAREIVGILKAGAEFAIEYLSRLLADWPSILSVFRCAEPGPLVDIDVGLGDRHRQGRSVVRLTFDSGFQILYKPRSVAVEAHFAELLHWVNARIPELRLRGIRALDRGDYGWSEWVAYEDCQSGEEVRAFYYAQGAHLAILLGLEAVDCYASNVIAARDQPVLVDLEGLFHPRFPVQGDCGALTGAQQAIEDSVLRSGLLPRALIFNGAGDSWDLSGLLGPADELSPEPLLVCENAGTDQMRFVLKRVPFPAQRNRPRLAGRAVELGEFADSILSGFRRTYSMLLAHRAEFLSEAGPLTRFAGDEVRVLLRPSYLYARLLMDSYHPSVLGSGIDRECVLSRLYSGRERLPHVTEDVLASEVADLRAGNIPIFTTRPGCQDLHDSRGHRFSETFPISGLEAARRRLARFNHSDLETQEWFIRASLATAAPGPERPNASACHRLIAARHPSADELIALADRVGRRLIDRCHPYRDTVSWPGLACTRKGAWVVTPIGWDLYGGLAGIALFFGFLTKATGRSEFGSFARRALDSARILLVDSGGPTAIGGFTGLGGWLYVLTHLGVLWQDKALLAEAGEVLPQLRPLIASSETLDVIEGHAGCIGTLLTYHAYTHDGAALQLALECAETIVARSTRKQGAPFSGSGFAHGVSGLAWSLVQVSRAAGREDLKVAAQELIESDRARRASGEARRLGIEDAVPPAGEDLEVTWCSGAPGVGLARLDCLEEGDNRSLEEIHGAVRTTLRFGFGQNHSQCHGDLGNLELLLAARQRLGFHGMDLEIEDLKALVFESVSERGMRCGTPQRVETPGFMSGLAGIGYGALRLAMPAEVPLVLSLAPSGAAVRARIVPGAATNQMVAAGEDK